MTLIEQASQAITELHMLTMSFSRGEIPNPVQVLAYQSKIVQLHTDIGQEMSQKFGFKEAAYIQRKIMEAKSYRKGRENLKTVADSSSNAISEIEEEYRQERQTAEEYESYRLMLQSLDKAFQHTFQVVSFVKSSENRSISS